MMRGRDLHERLRSVTNELGRLGGWLRAGSAAKNLQFGSFPPRLFVLVLSAAKLMFSELWFQYFNAQNFAYE